MSLIPGVGWRMMPCCQRARTGWYLPSGCLVCVRCSHGTSKACAAPRTYIVFVIHQTSRHFLLAIRDGWRPGTELPASLSLVPDLHPSLAKLWAYKQGVLTSRRAGAKLNIWEKKAIEGFGQGGRGSPRISTGGMLPKSFTFVAGGSQHIFQCPSLHVGGGTACGKTAAPQTSHLEIIYRRVKFINSCLWYK